MRHIDSSDMLQTNRQPKLYLRDTWYAVLFYLLSKTPVDFTSAIGSRLVRWNVRLNRREIIDQAKQNLSILCPTINSSKIDQCIDLFLDNIGRFMAEFAILDKIARENRITISGVEDLRDLVGKKPVIAAMLHTGNWETFSPAMMREGIPVASFYEPPQSPIERRIVKEVREKMGVRLLEPTIRGIRKAISILTDKGIVALFVDEARNGKSMAPLFGRPPHTFGNLAVATRLARRTRSMIVVAHAERTSSCHFHLQISKPFALPLDFGSVEDDVAFLNLHIEPLILKNLHQWYYLDDSILPDTPSNS